MKKILLSIAVLCLPAMSVQASEAELALFNQLDTDQNGLISEVEAKVQPKLSPVFVTLDENKDGQLSLAEYELLAKD
ncbi:MAG: calcium-binding protein [Oceanospirillaceae bacterium]